MKPRDLPFTKYCAAGNDFVLVEEPPPDTYLRTLARTLCDRKSSIGADGLLLLNEAADTDSTSGPCWNLRVFNRDGTEGSLCLNGLRCAGLHLFLERMGAGNGDIELRMPACTVWARAGTARHEPVGGSAEYAVRLLFPGGPPSAARLRSLGDAENGLLGELLGARPVAAWMVDVGNPHLLLQAPPEAAPPASSGDDGCCKAPGNSPNGDGYDGSGGHSDSTAFGEWTSVFDTGQLDRLRLDRQAFTSASPECRRLADLLFEPGGFLAATGTNVSVFRPSSADEHWRLSTWERGVGATEACGSAALALLMLATRMYPRLKALRIRQPGGITGFDVTNEGLIMVGSARQVFTGTVPVFLD